MSQENVEIVRNGIDAWNQRDADLGDSVLWLGRIKMQGRGSLAAVALACLLGNEISRERACGPGFA
jgi:hypothetical protein